MKYGIPLPLLKLLSPDCSTPVILTLTFLSPSSAFLTYLILGTKMRDTIAHEDTAMMALERKTLASGLSCNQDESEREGISGSRRRNSYALANPIHCSYFRNNKDRQPNEHSQENDPECTKYVLAFLVLCREFTSSPCLEDRETEHTKVQNAE